MCFDYCEWMFELLCADTENKCNFFLSKNAQFIIQSRVFHTGGIFNL